MRTIGTQAIGVRTPIIKENDGIVKLLYPEFGFGVRITFPIKYKKQEN